MWIMVEGEGLLQSGPVRGKMLSSTMICTVQITVGMAQCESVWMEGLNLSCIIKHKL